MKPSKQELMRARDPDSDNDIVVADCPTGTWIVVYQGQPIQVRREHLYRDEKKYLPMSWSQRGSAERAAERLNQLFHTHDFEIAEIQGKSHL